MAELAQLEKCLSTEYQMPDEKWWEGARKSFGDLQSLLAWVEWHRPESEETPLEEAVDSLAISSDKARSTVNPLITILESGTHLLGLTARNEPLQCIAFGTVVPKRFKERFWEIVLVQPENEMVVYEASDSTGRYRFRFHNHIFQLVYIQSEDLVREYPNILSVPSSSLKSDFDLSNDLCTIIQTLQELRKHNAYFALPPVRTAYHYAKAWIISQGRFRNPTLKTDLEVTTTEIVQLLISSGVQPQKSASDPFSDFFNRFELKVFGQKCKELRVAYPSKYILQKSDNWLSSLQSQSLGKKINAEQYVELQLMHNGSGLQRIAWLKTVEHALPRLKTRLDDNKKLNWRLWPQRLLEIDTQGNHSQPQDDVYEAIYILGLTPSPNNTSFDPQASETKITDWISRLKENQNPTLYGEYWITALITHPTDFQDKKFTACPLSLEDAEPLLPPNERLFQSEVRAEFRPKSKNKKNVSAPNPINGAPKRKLRQASDVLTRLRYDSKFNIDEYKVGYNDRVKAEIVEKAASAWTTDVTADEFIPAHRIEYFKRYPTDGGQTELMWDRQSRMDKIFKESGN